MDNNFQDRTPPQNIEAEQAVLGAIFLEPNALITASEILMPDDFYRTVLRSLKKNYSSLTCTSSVAVTSWCNFTGTFVCPKARIASGRSILRLSILIPCVFSSV